MHMNIKMQSSGEYLRSNAYQRGSRQLKMLLMPNSEKCTRRHAGGNNSISVRFDRVTGQGHNLMP